MFGDVTSLKALNVCITINVSKEKAGLRTTKADKAEVLTHLGVAIVRENLSKFSKEVMIDPGKENTWGDIVKSVSGLGAENIKSILNSHGLTLGSNKAANVEIFLNKCFVDHKTILAKLAAGA